MYCSKCGVEIASGSKFCIECGCKVGSNQPSSISIEGGIKGRDIHFGDDNSIDSHDKIITKIRQDNRKRTNVKIGGVVIIVGVLLLAGFFFLRDSNGGVRGGMPTGRYYTHDGENFMDEILDPLIANMMIFEFRGRGQGTQHLPMGVSVAFDYTIQGDRLLITMQGATLEYILSDNKESFYDSTGMMRFVRRR